MAQRRDQPFHELFREGVKFSSIHRRGPQWTERGGRRFFAGQPAPPPMFVQAGAAKFAYADALQFHLNTAFVSVENTLISGIISAALKICSRSAVRPHRASLFCTMFRLI